MNTKGKILVVEDSIELRKPVVDILNIEGYRVFEAEDGNDALNMLHKEIPDIIICDIMMPGLDGYGLLDRVRKRQDTANVPFVFLTAKTDPRDVRKGMHHTAEDYLTKPVRISDLLKTVETQLVKTKRQSILNDERARELREAIAGKLPHELITPLTSILALSELLSKDVSSFSLDDIEEFSGDIYNSGQRLLSTIRNYLLYSELTFMRRYGKDSVPSHNMTYVHIHSNVIEVSRQISEKWNRAYDLQSNLGEGKIHVNANYFENIVSQLVDNAFKFSEPGTDVCVETSLNDGSFKLTVTDHGRGMLEKDIRNIEVSKQFNRDKYEQQGAGLGLAIVKMIVELYNGTFQIEQGDGVGTQISLSIPVKTTNR